MRYQYTPIPVMYVPVLTSRKAYMVARIASPLIATLCPPIPSMLARSALVTGGILFIMFIEFWVCRRWREMEIEEEGGRIRK